jgi:hypothetical protein
MSHLSERYKREAEDLALIQWWDKEYMEVYLHVYTVTSRRGN